MKAPILDQFDKIHNQRFNYESEWQAISEILDPESAAFTSTNTNGYVSRRNIWDSTPERAVDDLVSSMMAMLAMPDKEWGTLNTESPERNLNYEEELALQVATGKCLAHFARSKTNFYNAEADTLVDVAIYGQGYTYMYPDYRKKIVKFANVPVQECYAQRDAYGKLTSWYRKFSMTPIEMYNEFSDSKHNSMRADQKKNVKDKIKHDPAYKYEVIQAIMSKTEAEAIGLKVDSNKAWVQVFADQETRATLHIDYLKWFPVLAPSWVRKAKSPYGRGRGHKALPEIRVLNKMIITNLTAGETMVNGAKMVPYEIFPTGQLDNSPGALNWYSISDAMVGTGVIKPEDLTNVTNLPISLEMENFRRQQISEIFFADLLQEFKNAEMSATESTVRNLSRTRKMSSPLMRFQDEYLAQAFDFVYHALIDFKIIEVPDSLKQEDMTVSFTTGLHEAYQMGKLQQLERGMQAVANTKGIPPELLPELNEEEFIKFVFTHAGASLQVLEEPGRAREKREEQQQLQASQVAVNQAQALRQVSEAQQAL